MYVNSSPNILSSALASILLSSRYTGDPVNTRKMEDLIDLVGRPGQFYNMRLPPFWLDKPASWFG